LANADFITDARCHAARIRKYSAFCLEKAKVNMKLKGRPFMNNRVLSRMGARELSKEEVDAVIGAGCKNKPCTLTVCTIDSTGALDGDVTLHEC
jgi:hypothetical protein